MFGKKTCRHYVASMLKWKIKGWFYHSSTLLAVEYNLHPCSIYANKHIHTETQRRIGLHRTPPTAKQRCEVFFLEKRKEREKITCVRSFVGESSLLFESIPFEHSFHVSESMRTCAFSAVSICGCMCVWLSCGWFYYCAQKSAAYWKITKQSNQCKILKLWYDIRAPIGSIHR